MTVENAVWIIAALGFLSWAAHSPARSILRDRECDRDEDDTDHPAGP